MASQGVIKINPNIDIPQQRIEFWRKTMEKISQKVKDGELFEDEANKRRAKIIAYEECLATTDPLTKLYNRRGFEENIQKAVALAKRNSWPFSLLFIDADDLKAMNEHGHDKGDEFLIRISMAIRESTRAGDIASRWAGDEFVVSCLGANLEGALLIANRILDKARSYEIAGKKVSVTIAAGEINTAKSEEINERLNEIDEGLLKAKMTGKNKVVSVDLNG